VGERCRGLGFAELADALSHECDSAVGDSLSGDDSNEAASVDRERLRGGTVATEPIEQLSHRVLESRRCGPPALSR
jgi:hypothetical protein